LLDAGLNIFQVFVVNAHLLHWMTVFEVNRRAADTRGGGLRSVEHLVRRPGP
jgi:hypothetical protein